jgi:hypothetical protein
MEISTLLPKIEENPAIKAEIVMLSPSSLFRNHLHSNFSSSNVWFSYVFFATHINSFENNFREGVSFCSVCVEVDCSYRKRHWPIRVIAQSKPTNKPNFN